MKKILITGGAGFIASSLAEHLSRKEEYQVILFDNLLTGALDNIPTCKQVSFIKGDVNKENEIRSVMTSYHFDYVFHYAAMVGVRRTLDNPIGVLNDIDGIKNILSLSKETGVKRVFYSSSSEVYGEPVEFPQNEETTPLNSKLPYGIVKNVGEAYFRSYQKVYGLDYTIFRFFNTYGPRQSHDFVIPKFIHAALNNKDITIYGDGSQTRTFCYIQDNIDFTIRVLEEGCFVNQTVNIGCSIQTTIIELARKIIELCDSQSQIVHLPPLTEGDMSARMPDNTKMQGLIGGKMTPLNEGLEEIIKAKRLGQLYKSTLQSQLVQVDKQ